MSENKNLTFQMKIDGIKVNKFSLNQIDDIDENAIPKTEFLTDFRFGVFPDSEKLSFKILIQILIPELENEQVAEIDVEVFFKILPFESVVTKLKENKFRIPNSLMYNLATLSISTARGILFEKLKGTPLQNIILPLVDPAQLFNNSEDINIEE